MFTQNNKQAEQNLDKVRQTAAKSENLSQASVSFYERAKQLNQDSMNWSDHKSSLKKSFQAYQKTPSPALLASYEEKLKEATNYLEKEQSVRNKVVDIKKAQAKSALLIEHKQQIQTIIAEKRRAEDAAFEAKFEYLAPVVITPLTEVNSPPSEITYHMVSPASLVTSPLLSQAVTPPPDSVSPLGFFCCRSSNDTPQAYENMEKAAAAPLHHSRPTKKS